MFMLPPSVHHITKQCSVQFNIFIADSTVQHVQSLKSQHEFIHNISNHYFTTGYMVTCDCKIKLIIVIIISMNTR